MKKVVREETSDLDFLIVQMFYWTFTIHLQEIGSRGQDCVVVGFTKCQKTSLTSEIIKRYIKASTLKKLQSNF